MGTLPSGTVTFVFTDIEGSTRLLHALGEDAYAQALAEHRRVVRRAFDDHGGVEVDTQGDAFFYAFPTAPGALGGARDAQQGLSDSPVRVRIGVHTGTPLSVAEGYVGEDVHRAARIAACGHAGQVLVSASTAALAGGDLVELGLHRLKDLSAPERIYQLGPGDFPPLKSLYQTNLPVPRTPFLGRERELGELLARDDARLVTLTGAGGTGKTRLAIQAAGLAGDGYADGVWWVPLAPLRDPALVLATAAQTLGAAEELREHIGDRHMLVLFDNFEHVMAAASELGELLESCPRLDLVVTSREPLHLAAEREYAVPPLDRAEAVAFFSARARAVKADFEANGEVWDICLRLDDLPLALELAAVRVKALSPGQIRERLEQRLPLLTGGARDLPERQRTLRATIEWSFDLLAEDEQRLFRRLSVFAGGCTLAAAEQVADADIDTLHSLLDKSLVRRLGGRFWMLESIREYAAESLDHSGEADDLRLRHASYLVDLAVSTGVSSLEPLGSQRYAEIRPEHDNIRAALGWCLEADPALGLRLATAFEAFWTVTDPSEGIRWLEMFLRQAAAAPLELRAHAFRALGSCANPAGDDLRAEQAYERSLQAFRELGDDRGTAVLLFRLGISSFYRGDTRRAATLAAESLALNREVGYPVGEAQALGLLGEIEWAAGDPESGVELIRESADLAGEAGFPWWRSRMLRKLADCQLELGLREEAEVSARESLQIMSEIGDRQMMVFALARLARLAAEAGRPGHAGLLWGAIEAEEGRHAMGAWAKERDRFAAPLTEATEPAFESGREQGRLLQLEDAIGLALAGPG